MILFNILESEDSYEDLESIISKVFAHHFGLTYPPHITYCVLNLY